MNYFRERIRITYMIRRIDELATFDFQYLSWSSSAALGQRVSLLRWPTLGHLLVCSHMSLVLALGSIWPSSSFFLLAYVYIQLQFSSVYLTSFVTCFSPQRRFVLSSPHFSTYVQKLQQSSIYYPLIVPCFSICFYNSFSLPANMYKCPIRSSLLAPIVALMLDSSL